MDENMKGRTDEHLLNPDELCTRGAGSPLDRNQGPGTVREALSYIAAYLDNFSGTWKPTLGDGRPNHLGASLVMLWKWLGKETDRRTTANEPRGEGWSL